MKKRFVPLALVVALLCSLFPFTAAATPAYTEQESSIVNYTVEEPGPQDTGGSGGPSNPAAGKYIVNIPTSIELNYEDSVVFTLGYNSLADNQRIALLIDGSRTFEQPENKFFLRYKEGDTLYGRIECILKRGSSKDFTIPPSDILTGPDDALIAVFDKSGTQAYGWLAFEPVVKPDDTPGPYTGTIYFKVEVYED